MRSRSCLVRRLVLALGALLAPVVSGSQEPGAGERAQVQQGRYMAAAADCSACHTEPGHGAAFAGGK